MASPSQNFTPRLYHGVGQPLPAGLALLIYGLATATFFAIVLTLGDGLAASVVAQVVGFVLVPVAAMRLHGVTARELGLARPPLLGVIGALVIGAGLWLLALRLAAPVIEATGRQAATRELSRRLLAPATPLPLVLAVNALAPGVCEELLHRGLLLGALAPRLGRAGAIAIITVLFAALHLEPARMVAAALLGLVAGVLAAWGRSVWPAIVLHVVNNTVALALGAGALPTLGAVISRHPDGSTAGAVGVCVLGLSLGWLGRQRS
jgi:membrane protease YdiL (CAAX protease family)